MYLPMEDPRFSQIYIEKTAFRAEGDFTLILTLVFYKKLRG